MTLRATLQGLLTNPAYLLGWGILVATALGILVYDLRSNNAGLGSLMKFVWGFTVLYSGPIGLGVYWYAGRSQISRDSLWRRGFRSVCHCYSGCGAGEVTGVVVALGLLALDHLAVAAVTFGFAYVFGYALTVGPLVQEGVSFRRAVWDAFLSETPSITVMEVVAIGTDLWLAGDAGLTDVLFWSALTVSLSLGLVAAYPVNVLLISRGVKEGMMDPREAASGS
ncbi:DUF4396 domain-containing protein [Halorubrum sp. Atlit-8R]|uniref:DUF4396 domain-containing protein n=1 Tax=unclassified Halorubrum TaxID=2642239 RepID=UPI000EF1A4F0|nr:MULTISPECIES: DUF4396 domain-containing protein [unclassified Halorubrum]RLM63204.1 DUF4396 domain-containing protein [Halorubrum sp. Atlit-9R]RLM81982.1 DUF4396 domain-containing protein [Halorubrum sp. Atlit-8R]